MLNSEHGRLTIKSYTEKKNGHQYVLCDCICGKTKEIRLSHIKSGKIISCGCHRLEKSMEGRTGVDYVVTGSKLHNTWRGMKNRCYDTRSNSFKYYGGKGIVICDDWLYFKNFRDWAYLNGYEEGLTIDRIDPSGNYEPSNCRWLSLSDNTTEMLKNHHNLKTGAFKEEVINRISKNNKDKLGRKFMMCKDGIETQFNCLLDAAILICDKNQLETNPVQIKKNISACLNGKRKSCHGYTFKKIEK